MRNFSKETTSFGGNIKYTVKRPNFPSTGSEAFDETLAFILSHEKVETENQARQIMAEAYQSWAIGELLQSPKGGIRAAVCNTAVELGHAGSNKQPRKNLTDEQWAEIAAHENVTKAIAAATKTASEMVPGTGPRRGDGPTLSDQRKAVARAQAGDMTLDELGEYLGVSK